MRTLTFRALAAVVLLASSLASQVSLPPVNLGATSFLDGVAGPGVLIQPGVIEHYHAIRFLDSNGNVVPGKNSIDTWSNLVHVAFITKHRLLGGFYGAEFLLPAARVDVSTSFGPTQTQTGFGDVALSPLIIEWPGQTVLGKPYFSRFVAFAVLPTGSYSAERPINIGSNAGGAFAYYAFTVFPQPKWETSWRIHYLWNAKNTEPFAALHASSAQAGDAFHLNYATSYEMSPSLRLGLNGYYLQQMHGHRLNGSTIARSRERVFAIGPGGVWSRGSWALFANVDIETLVRNRSEGYRVNATLQRVFPKNSPARD